MNLSSNEKEQDGVRRDDNQSWDEETQEPYKRALDVAGASSVSVFIETSSKCAEYHWDSPTCDMVILFKTLMLSVSSHNHLVEVESNAEGPQEICQKIVMHEDGDNNARSGMIDYPLLEGY